MYDISQHTDTSLLGGGGGGVCVVTPGPSYIFPEPLNGLRHFFVEMLPSITTLGIVVVLNREVHGNDIFKPLHILQCYS